MTKPTILTVDDDRMVLGGDHPRPAPPVRRRLPRRRRDVGGRGTDGPGRARPAHQPVALILADQRMPQMTGIELLEQARAHAPDAKLLLLTAYADTDVAIKAINDIGLDYYLLKPWDPPEERLYPVIDDLLGDWRRPIPTTPPTCGSSAIDGPTAATRSRRSWPATTCPTAGTTSSATPRASGCSELAKATPDDLPLVLVPDGERCASPSTLEVAGALGLRTDGRAAAVRRLHRRRRTGRSGRRGLCRVRGSEHGHRRARGAGRPGRPERGDRELSRVSQGAERLRSGAPRDRPGLPFRRRDGAGPRCRRSESTADRCARRSSTAAGRSRPDR